MINIISNWESSHTSTEQLKANPLTTLSSLSNSTVANIEEAVAPLKEFFSPILGIDNAASKNKADTLKEVAEQWNLSADEIIYVADTKYDYECSKKNRILFLGLTWGYEDLENCPKIEKADSTEQLEKLILSHVCQK